MFLFQSIQFFLLDAQSLRDGVSECQCLYQQSTNINKASEMVQSGSEKKNKERKRKRDLCVRWIELKDMIEILHGTRKEIEFEEGKSTTIKSLLIVTLKDNSLRGRLLRPFPVLKLDPCLSLVGRENRILWIKGTRSLPTFNRLLEPPLRERLVSLFLFLRCDLLQSHRTPGSIHTPSFLLLWLLLSLILGSRDSSRRLFWCDLC